MIRRIIPGLVLVFAAAQFFRPARNLSAGPGPNDITRKYAVPAPVQKVLERACYDCHSNRTHYPWYAEVQPVGWWLDSHIRDGKRHLNFSEFSAYETRRSAKKLRETAELVEQGKMPLKSYTLVHPEARLTPDEVKLLLDWATGLQRQVAAL